MKQQKKSYTNWQLSYMERQKIGHLTRKILHTRFWILDAGFLILAMLSDVLHEGGTLDGGCSIVGDLSEVSRSLITSCPVAVRKEENA